MVKTEKQLKQLSKAKLAEMLTEMSVTFDTGLKQKELIELILKQNQPIEQIENIDLDKEIKPSSKKQLDEKLEQILQEATRINEQWTSLKTQTERDGFVQALGELHPGFDELIRESFTDSYDAPISQDLPNSEIISNIPVRVMEQILANISITYPLMDTIELATIRNGIRDIFYADYRDSDDTSAWSDVALKDFNAGLEPIYKETFKASVNIHKAFDMLSNELNDITFSMGLFVSLVKNYALAISRPMNKALYSRYITFLDTDDSYDEVINFKSDVTAEKAKELKAHFISLSTPSRDNLKKKPDGSVLALEYAMNMSNVHMVINTKFATDYTYDILANTFQLNKVTYNVKSIRELDFTKLGKYSTGADKGANLAVKELLIIEDSVYFENKHFEAAKEMNTPKLKTVTHSYMRVVNGRRKDRYLGSFIPKV